MADRSMPSSFDDDTDYQENGYQKISRKIREEPLIPLGTALTLAALFNAWRAMRRGDSRQLNRMLRARVGAQAFTVLAMVAGGAYYGEDRKKRKELIKLEAEQRAEERNQKWLRELEVRDEEDKKLQAAMKRKRERLEQKRAGKGGVKEGEEEGDKGKERDPNMASTTTIAATPATTMTEVSGEGGEAKDSAKKESKVLSALSETKGGWFGSSKKTENAAEQSGSDPKPDPKSDAESPKS
ncbi:mitochondrial hypoxia responsive domain-containing protein [Poronia punctata]|nr:mitochondrial hypoxia responsive domain-containing protein [Poronia punctata]